MAWDGSGNFIRTDGARTGASVWEQARDANVLVNAPDADTHDEDVATGDLRTASPAMARIAPRPISP